MNGLSRMSARWPKGVLTKRPLFLHFRFRMNMSNSPIEAVNLNSLGVAQAWLATAENSVQMAKLESRTAKRRRKEARQAARRAKKRLRRAEEELAEARAAVAEAEKKQARALHRQVPAEGASTPASSGSTSVVPVPGTPERGDLLQD